MDEIAIAAVSHLFHKHLAKTHVNAPFNLSYGEDRINGLADIMSNPDARHHNDSRFRMDLDFRNRCCATEGRRWTNRGAFVFSRGRRRLVGSRCTECSVFLFRKANSVDETDPLVRIL